MRANKKTVTIVASITIGISVLALLIVYLVYQSKESKQNESQSKFGTKKKEMSKKIHNKDSKIKNTVRYEPKKTGQNKNESNNKKGNELKNDKTEDNKTGQSKNESKDKKGNELKNDKTEDNKAGQSKNESNDKTEDKNLKNNKTEDNKAGQSKNESNGKLGNELGNDKTEDNKTGQSKNDSNNKTEDKNLNKLEEDRNEKEENHKQHENTEQGNTTPAFRPNNTQLGSALQNNPNTRTKQTGGCLNTMQKNTEIKLPTEQEYPFRFLDIDKFRKIMKKQKQERQNTKHIDAEDFKYEFDNTCSGESFYKESTLYENNSCNFMSARKHNSHISVLLRSMLIYEPIFEYLSKSKFECPFVLDSILLNTFCVAKNTEKRTSVIIEKAENQLCKYIYGERGSIYSDHTQPVREFYDLFFNGFQKLKTSKTNDNNLLVFPEIKYKIENGNGIQYAGNILPMLKTILKPEIRAYNDLLESSLEHYYAINEDNFLKKINYTDLFVSYGKYLTFQILVSDLPDGKSYAPEPDLLKQIIPKMMNNIGGRNYKLKILIRQEKSHAINQPAGNAFMYVLRGDDFYLKEENSEQKITEENFYKSLQYCELIIIYEVCGK